MQFTHAFYCSQFHARPTTSACECPRKSPNCGRGLRIRRLREADIVEMVVSHIQTLGLTETACERLMC